MAANSTENRTKIVTVWLDETSDECRWIVDEDIVSGGESNTIKAFLPTAEGFEKAVAFAEKAAAKRGCKMRVDGSASDSPGDWCEDCDSVGCECEE